MLNPATRRVVVAAMVLSIAAVGAAGPTPGLPAKMRVLVAADEMPEMFSFATSPRGPSAPRTSRCSRSWTATSRAWDRPGTS